MGETTSGFSNTAVYHINVKEPHGCFLLECLSGGILLRIDVVSFDLHFSLMRGVAYLISIHLIGVAAVLGLDYIVPYHSGATRVGHSDTAWVQAYLCPMDRPSD